MARPKAIPARLHEAILTQAGDGRSTRQIAEWLLAEHKLKIGHVAIHRFLTERRGERRVAAEAVIAERTAKSLTSDLDVLDAQLLDVRAVADAFKGRLIDEDGKATEFAFGRIGQTPAASVYANLVGRVESLLATKMKHAGLGSGQGAPQSPASPDSQEAALRALAAALAGERDGGE